MENDLQNKEQQVNDDATKGQTIIVQNTISKQSNGMGVAGFVLALLALFLGWIPFLGWVLWLLGLIISVVGVTRKPRGLAIAGLVISLLGIIMLIFILGAIGALATVNKL